MIRVLRLAALAVAATSLAGCALVPVVALSDQPSEPPETTAATSDADASTAKVALDAAVVRLSVVNEGSYTLWLESKDEGSTESTYFVRTTTQYDLSRGMVEAEIDTVDGTMKVRILKSEGVAFLKAKPDGGSYSCWYRMPLKEFNALPDVPFAYDLEAESPLSTLLDEGAAQSIEPDPDDSSGRIVRVRSSIQNVLRVAAPGDVGLLSMAGKRLKGRMDVDVYLFGNEVTYVDIDLVPVYEALEKIGIDPVLSFTEHITDDEPRAGLEPGDLKDSFKVTVPKNLCPAGVSRPRLSKA